MERLVTYLRCSGHLSWSSVLEAARGVGRLAEVATWGHRDLLLSDTCLLQGQVSARMGQHSGHGHGKQTVKPAGQDKRELISASFHPEGFPLGVCSAQLRIIIVTRDLLLLNWN